MSLRTAFGHRCLCDRTVLSMALPYMDDRYPSSLIILDKRLNKFLERQDVATRHAFPSLGRTNMATCPRVTSLHQPQAQNIWGHYFEPLTKPTHQLTEHLLSVPTRHNFNKYVFNKRATQAVVSVCIIPLPMDILELFVYFFMVGTFL
jgi:hypothetical protein